MAGFNLGGVALNTVGEALAFIAGVAIGPTLAPISTAIVQEAWQVADLKALEPDDVARIVAQRIHDLAAGQHEAAMHGINGDRFTSLRDAQLRAPAVGELVTLLRRGKVDDHELEHALHKAQLEDGWLSLVADLAPAQLDPGELAKAIHRGIMRGAGLLVAEPSTTPGNVPIVPPSDLDPVEQAAWSGLTHEQLRILVGNAGLPPGIVQGLELLNRGKITEDDFSRLVGESNMRNEWTPALLHLRRRLLTPHEYAEADLRGVKDSAEARAGAALSGLEADDYATLFAIIGRPLNVHAITTGLARGGTFGGTYDDVPEPYRDAIRRSAVRPEYAVLAHANRYSYPSAFVLRSLVQSGELTADDGHQVLLEVGWKPELAAKVATAWGGSSGGAGKKETAAELADEYEGGFVTEAEYRTDLAVLGYAGHELDLLVHLGDARRAKRYREKVVDAIAAAYVAFRLTDTAAVAELAGVHVTGAAATQLVALWNLQRLATIRELTPAQIKKAHKDGILDDATALQALEWEHYSAADAETYLAE